MKKDLYASLGSTYNSGLFRKKESVLENIGIFAPSGKHIHIIISLRLSGMFMIYKNLESWGSSTFLSYDIAHWVAHLARQQAFTRKRGVWGKLELYIHDPHLTEKICACFRSAARG